jgi:hypothetical protein
MHIPTSSTLYQERDLCGTLLGDGRPLLLLTGVGLAVSGAFALFLALTGQFLPHDIAFLGMSVEQLCMINQCEIVRFMIHDRIAFGGALLSIGLLYLWLTEFPLKAGYVWAWWALLASGILGFGSFLTYLTTGYLDSWHGLASLGLLPCFAIGLVRARKYLLLSQASLSWKPGIPLSWRSRLGIGRICLFLTALGMFGAGMTILVIGSTVVFVPQDLAFLCLTPDAMQAINTRLIPLIAHDRMGFGGAVATTGLVVFAAVWYSPPSRHLWQILCLTSLIGFSSAIGAHPWVGYLDAVHLAPAVLGGLLCMAGVVLCYRPMIKPMQG